MKISTKGRYALRMMLDIAVHDTGEPVRIRDIAARQEISVKYLEQIVSVLARAGYVKSIRGASGRISPYQKARGISSGGYPEADRRQPCPGGMSGRRGKYLPKGGRLYYTFILEKAGCSHS